MILGRSYTGYEWLHRFPFFYPANGATGKHTAYWYDARLVDEARTADTNPEPCPATLVLR
jgi:hypothetical protein